MVYRYNPGATGTGEKAYNSFRNDGSFLETFKKLQEAQQKQKESEEGPSVEKEAPSTSTAEKKDNPKPLPFVGKRRGGRVLPTGKVKKLKSDQDSESAPKDAWSLYLAEVKRYRETTCEEDGKTRPLVK